MGEYDQSDHHDPTISYKTPEWSTTLWGVLYLIGDVVEETFGPSWNLHVVGKMEIFHIMRALAVLSDNALSCRSEGFYCVALSLFHLNVVICHLDARHGLSSVDIVGTN